MKIAFVAPFFGERASGGAESECRQTALRLAQQGIEVEILTTCLLDLAHGMTVNAYPQGITHDGDVLVRRFRAAIFDPGPFGQLNQRLIDKEVLTADEERHFMARNVNSFDLYRYIASNSDDYDWLCFIPYLFGTSCYGTEICPEKSILIPCLHDEGYTRMQLVQNMFKRVARIAFHTPAEMKLAEELFGPAPSPHQRLLIGEGVNVDFESNSTRFRDRFSIHDPFIMYAGRKDSTKNVDTLIQYFSDYKRLTKNKLKLVLVGPREAAIPTDMTQSIVDLGFVDDQDKKDAYSAATLFCQPSRNESFSIVIMEAWVCGTPCLVHGQCAVTRDHAVLSGGGIPYTHYGEFKGSLDYLLENSEIRHTMGKFGRQYVLDNFAWNRIIDRYRNEAIE